MSFETAKIGSAEIIFDKEETEKYYTEHIYSCECQDCRNFYEHIKRNPELLGFLADFGLKFNSVEEILSWDLGNDKDSLIHHEAYYVVCGRIEGNDVEFEKFGVKISFLKEASVPGDRQGEYFFIAIENGFPFILDEERDFPTRKSGAWKTVKETMLVILAVPFIVLFLLIMLILTPFDYFKYKMSRYYKDTKEKYSWFCTETYHIKLYNQIKKENLPIDYYRCEYAPITGYGFFVYKDTLIINDCVLYYDTEKNKWLVESENGEDYAEIQDTVKSEIERCNEYLKADVCKKAAILINEEVFEEQPAPEYENIRFITVKNDRDIEPLKELIK